MKIQKQLKPLRSVITPINLETQIPRESEEDYYVFKIKEWKKLHRKIEVKGYQVVRVMYTTEYLLNNAEIVTELCIRSKEE